MKKAKPSGQSDQKGTRRKKQMAEALLEQRTRKLEELLATGNFRKASEEFGGLFRNVDCLQLPIGNPWRAKATAAIRRMMRAQLEN